jgi:trigger factor
LEVTVDRTGPCEATVSLTVPSEEFERQAAQVLKHHGRSVRMKGFRPGKVPLGILERQFGEGARKETAEHFLGMALREAISEHSLAPIGHPQIDPASLEVVKGEEFSHTFGVNLRPEIELGEYKGLTIESELEPVLEQEIESAVDSMRGSRATPEPLEDGGLEEGGMALCKLAWKVGDETIFEREGMRLSTSDAIPGVAEGVWSEHMTGAGAGAEIEVPMTVPDDFEREDVRGAEGVCRVEVGEVFRMVPPSDEELWEMAGAEDAEAFTARVRKDIERFKEEREQTRVEGKLLERVLESHDFDLPETMVENQLQGRLEALRGQLVEQGQTEEEADQQAETETPNLRTSVEKGAKAFFLVSKIAEEEGVKISDTDMAAELTQIAQRNQASVEEVRDYYRENGLLDQVAIELVERRVRTLLRENADITQPS